MSECNHDTGPWESCVVPYSSDSGDTKQLLKSNLITWVWHPIPPCAALCVTKGNLEEVMTFPTHLFSWGRMETLTGRLVLVCLSRGVGKRHPAGHLQRLWPVFLGRNATIFTLSTETLQQCKPSGNVAQIYCSISEVYDLALLVGFPHKKFSR